MSQNESDIVRAVEEDDEVRPLVLHFSLPGFQENILEKVRLVYGPCLDLYLPPFYKAIKGKTIFSYCFIKHHVGLFITPFPRRPYPKLQSFTVVVPY